MGFNINIDRHKLFFDHGNQHINFDSSEDQLNNISCIPTKEREDSCFQSAFDTSIFSKNETSTHELSYRGNESNKLTHSPNRSLHKSKPGSWDKYREDILSELLFKLPDKPKRLDEMEEMIYALNECDKIQESNKCLESESVVLANTESEKDRPLSSLSVASFAKWSSDVSNIVSASSPNQLSTDMENEGRILNNNTTDLMCSITENCLADLVDYSSSKSPVAEAYECQFCHSFVKNKKKLKEHEFNVHIAVTDCRWCGLTCPGGNIAMDKHLLSHKFKCNLCGCVCPTVGLLRNHLRKFHKINRKISNHSSTIK